MDFKEQAYSVLIVSASEKFNSSLVGLLPEFKYHQITFADNVSTAKREILEREYDFIMINTPLPDGDGIRFAIDASSGKNCVSTLFVRAEMYDSIFEKASPNGIYIISKPTSKQMINTALDWMATTRERLRKLEKKTTSLEDKMSEIRIVNRAKWLLISNLKMTEADAHRYIEKEAMDRCVSKREISEKIIKTYS